jgi:hypothetical protein
VRGGFDVHRVDGCTQDDQGLGPDKAWQQREPPGQQVPEVLGICGPHLDDPVVLAADRVGLLHLVELANQVIDGLVTVLGLSDPNGEVGRDRKSTPLSRRRPIRFVASASEIPAAVAKLATAGVTASAIKLSNCQSIGSSAPMTALYQTDR